MVDLNYARKPCAECPWRTDAEPGKFPLANFAAMAHTVGHEDRPVLPDRKMFACHMSGEGKEIACAGWLVTHGRYHIGVRMAIALEALPVEALEPGENWPELYPDFQAMVAAQQDEEDA
jgi:hypothetical protein